MCDYSLAHFPNRLAVEGEELVVRRFATQTLGLAPARPSLKQFLFRATLPAICVPPGARLLLQDIPRHLQQSLGVRATEEVIFLERSLEAFTYRDAVRFSNGLEILLQRLDPGQRVRVMRLDPDGEVELPQNHGEDRRPTLVG